MHLTRRDFVVLSSLGFVGSLGDRWVFAQAPAQAPTVPEFKDVRRNVGVFTARGGTIGYLVTPDAVVVVDSQFADTAPMFLKGLQPKTSRKIDFLINSHHHPDHTGGNKAMQPNVGKIVAHVNVPGLQKKKRPSRRPKRTRPTRIRRSTRTGRRRWAGRRSQRGTTARGIPAATSRSSSRARTSCTWAT